MKPESALLLEKILKCKSLSVAKAHVEAIQLIEQQANLFSVKMQPKHEGQALINCIKELRELTGLGLREAKDAVEMGYTWEGLGIHEAQKIVSQMTKVGARIAFQ